MLRNVLLTTNLFSVSGVTMKELKKILAVVDPTASDQPAVRRAAWLANKSGAELELLVCYYNEYLSGDRLFLGCPKVLKNSGK